VLSIFIFNFLESGKHRSFFYIGKEMSIKIYFAGKVTKGGGYRQNLLKSGRAMSDGESEYIIDGMPITYIGPFAIGCDHGCYHRNFHGISWESREQNSFPVCGGGDINPIPPYAVVISCTNQIRRCDLFYAYIDSLDCYGTIAEIAIAAENKKEIYIEINEKIKKQIREMWFVLHLPNIFCRYVKQPQLGILYVKENRPIPAI